MRWPDSDRPPTVLGIRGHTNAAADAADYLRAGIRSTRLVVQPASRAARAISRNPPIAVAPPMLDRNLLNR